MSTDERLMRSLARVQDPEIRRPLTELGMISSAEVENGRARIQVKLTVAHCPAADRIRDDVITAAAATEGVDDVELDVSVMDPAERKALIERLKSGRPMQFGPETLTRIIAVTSGKGGVGKSTVTANLAAALAARGQHVGIIDADVHGYSIPAILGLTDKPTRVGELMMPPTVHGMQVISIGMFVDGNQSVSWRGPMLHRTLEQFLRDVWWGDLDTLVIDMPPGTGDVAISLGQLLPHAEVIVVTTPQRSAADVAERSALVARQTGQRVLGVVENMAGLTQADGTVLEVFGSGGGDDVAARLDVPVLARIPLDIEIREGGDAGVPVATRPGPAGSVFDDLVTTLSASRKPLLRRNLPLRP